jgi:hypothetical protein
MGINDPNALRAHYFRATAKNGARHVDHLTQHFRQRAEEFRRMAEEKFTEKQARNSFLKLARSYDVLAKAEEAA